MEDLSIYFTPVSSAEFKSQGDQIRTLGDITEFNNDGGMPDLDGVKIAIIGVNEFRGVADGGQYNSALTSFRSYLYKLSAHTTSLRLVDLGDINPGNSIDDTYHAVSSSIESLMKAGIIPLVIGGSQDLTYAHYRAYEKMEQTINLVSIDPRFDLGDVEGPLHSESYLGKIVLHQPNFLFNFSNIAYQSYFVDNSVKELMDGLHFESYRLGEVRANIQQSEPIVRNADMISFDLASIRMSDAPAAIGASPHGFYGEEACSLARYAGMSDKLSSIGFYNLIDRNDNGQTAHLLAQLVWFFIDGYLGRKKDFPIGSKDGYTKYRVGISNGDHEIIFLKSPASGRWWMEVPYPPDERLRLARHAMVPCNYSDYEQAMKDEMPDLWIKTYLKLG